MPARLMIACAQINVTLMDKAANLARVLARLEEAASHGAELVVFPECALTGYCFASRDEAEPYAEALPGPSTEALVEACRRTGTHAIVGLLESAGGRLYNAAVLVGPRGIVGRYRKAHLPTLGVDRFVDHGDRPFEVLATPVGRIGLNICFDASFPEGVRALALAGAEVVALPTNWPQGRDKVPNFVVNTRALENRVYFAACNRVGRERRFEFIGLSKVAGPTGDTLASAGTSEEIIYAAADLDAARTKTTVFIPGEFELRLWDERRPELYGSLAEPSGVPLEVGG